MFKASKIYESPNIVGVVCLVEKKNPWVIHFRGPELSEWTIGGSRTVKHDPVLIGAHKDEHDNDRR